MIIEPTGWAIQCDRCDVEQTIDGAADEGQVLAYARSNGWLVVAEWEFCSLDCLIERRRHPRVREAMAAHTRQHMATHVDRCCRLHRTHAQRGRHDLTECVEPRLAGVSVL